MFLWRNKFLVLLALLVLGYLHVNPARQFGIVRPQLVVYNRVPILFFDLFIGYDGKSELYDDVSETRSFDYFWRSEAPRLRKTDQDYVFIIGAGFEGDSRFKLDQHYEDSLLMSGVDVLRAPNPQAARKYNELKEQNRPVAILMKLK